MVLPLQKVVGLIVEAAAAGWMEWLHATVCWGHFSLLGIAREVSLPSSSGQEQRSSEMSLSLAMRS